MLGKGRLVKPLIWLTLGVIIAVGLVLVPWVTRGIAGVSQSDAGLDSIPTAVPSNIRGLYDRGVQALDEAIRRNPYIDGASYSRGSANVDLGQYERAIEDYGEDIRLIPDDPRAYYNRGVAYTFIGDYDRAIEDINEAARLDPEFADAYLIRGLIYQALGYPQLYNRNIRRAWELGVAP